MQVFKFGGASVKDAEAIKNVASILKRHVKESTVVVISAMGKTTNKLEELTNAYYYKRENVKEILTELKNFHAAILSTLIPDKQHAIYNAIENVFVELLWALEEEPAFTYNFHYDQLVSQGEVLATKIICAYLDSIDLKNKWLDIRGIIQTDNSYREGIVDYDLSQKLVTTELMPIFKSVDIIVTQGFIGGTSENYTTTLGREGSDYTAALIAYFTSARQVIIWKDVPGVLNADPKYFKNAKKINEINYHDAIELTYYGASVIHPKTIKPLQNKNIPLYVKSFVNPDEEGTVIKDTEKRSEVTSYIFKVNQILISIQPKDFSFIVEENLSVIFNLFSKHQVHVNMMQNSAISFSVCIDDDDQKINNLMTDLKQTFKVLYNKNVELLTVRNYDQEIIAQLSGNKLVLIEQRSRTTLQMVMKEE